MQDPQMQPPGMLPDPDQLAGAAPMDMGGGAGAAPGDPQFNLPAQPPGPPPAGAAGQAPLQAPPAGPSLAQQMPLPQAGAPTTIKGAINESKKVADENGAAAQLATTSEQEALRKQAAIDDAEAKALGPTLEHQKAAADALVSFKQQTVRDYDQRFQKLQTDYATTQQELDAVRAKMHPTDIFGAAGVGRVQGTIAMILGAIGAGVDGQNSGVERLNQMAQQRAAQFQQEAQLIEKKGVMQQNMFQMARQKLGDDQAAYLATYEAQLEAVKAETQQVSNNFRSPRAQAQAKQLIAQLDQKLVAVQTQMGQNHSQVAMQGAIALGQQNLEREKMNLAAKTAAVKGMIAGYKGAIPEEGVHKELSSVNQGAQTVFQELGRVLEDYKSGQLSLSGLRDLMAERALISAPLRKFLLTGTRLEGQENNDINALRPTLMESIAAKFGDPTAATHKLEAARVDIMRSAIEQSRVAGLTPDLSDPVMRDYYQLQLAQDDKRKAAGLVGAGTPRAGSDHPGLSNQEADVARQMGY